MQGSWQDARLAVRRLAGSPGFTLAAVLSLGIGIGATSTVFGLVDALLLRPLPVAQPERVVAVYTSDFSGPQYGASSYPDYVAFRDAGVFEGLAAFTMAPLGVAGGFLYGLSPSDPVTFAGAVSCLAAVALVASFVPARRAGRVDPVASLRSE